MKVQVRFAMMVAVLAGLFGLGNGQTADAAMVTINTKTFDLNQFTGASVTYRTGGSVHFDGKNWDNAAGVDGFTLGELAAGQFGSDPGDQVTLQSRTGIPDWLQLNYGGSGIGVAAGGSEFVIYEITSATSGVDVEGTSFRVQFNNGTWHNASSGVATFFGGSSLPSPPNAENTNQIVFDLLNFGFSVGDLLTTVRIENLDTGAGTSDPDFIFAGLTAASPVPEPSSLVLFCLGAVGLVLAKKRRNCTSGSSAGTIVE